MAREAITVSMHQALKSAAVEPMGWITGADGGVVTALVRRGLARDDGTRVVITAAGRWAVDHAKLDPRSQPSSWTDEKFRAYIANRG